MEQIKEIIIVEGRDDTRQVKNAISCQTIETHGFGITKETWNLIEKAYNGPGIIIFTDPDFSGNEIRRKIKEKYPNAKEAFLVKEEAFKNGDIGIENASSDSIIKALNNAHITFTEKGNLTKEDLISLGLIGLDDSSIRRAYLGKSLNIGYSNGKTLLNKLNSFNIKKEEIEEVLKNYESI